MSDPIYGDACDCEECGDLQKIVAHQGKPSACGVSPNRLLKLVQMLYANRLVDRVALKMAVGYPIGQDWEDVPDEDVDEFRAKASHYCFEHGYLKDIPDD